MMRSEVVLVCGMGRSGTTFIASVLANLRGFLWVEEPNFVTDILSPYCQGTLEPQQAAMLLLEEGWRGPMKASRTMSEMYPETFGDNSSCAIRPYLRNALATYIDDTCTHGQRARVVAARRLLNTVVAHTLSATNRTCWLLKQPSAVEHIAFLNRLLPAMRVIHVTRNIDRVVLSRVLRGYQRNFDDALKLCRRRLIAAAHCQSILGPKRMKTIRIEDVAARPRESLNDLCTYLGVSPTTESNEAVMKISESRLRALGEPGDVFGRRDLRALHSTKNEMNSLFGANIV